MVQETEAGRAQEQSPVLQTPQTPLWPPPPSKPRGRAPPRSCSDRYAPSSHRYRYQWQPRSSGGFLACVGVTAALSNVFLLPAVLQRLGEWDTLQLAITFHTLCYVLYGSCTQVGDRYAV